MFEQYTEAARRALFVALHEAVQTGSASIEPEHLLLGILEADDTLALQLLGSADAVEQIRRQVRPLRPAPKRDLPLSNGSKRVLAYCAEESLRLKHRQFGPGHLLLGLLREGDSEGARLLREHGVELSRARELVEKARSVPATTHEELVQLLNELPVELWGKAARSLRALKRAP